MISIVIPTKNEEENIGKLLKQIELASKIHDPKFEYEAIVIDDSDNGQTAYIAAMEQATIVGGQGKGLGRAIIDGIEKSNGEIIIVMDADLSHNPHAIPGLIRPILNNGYDMVVGSRYIEGGKTVGWSKRRIIVSRIAGLLGMAVTGIKDASSGFFAFRSSILVNTKLKADSWKIMLEILVKAKPTRVIELPIQFEVRRKGKSKFNSKQVLLYLKHLGLLAFWKYQKFIKFCIVGGTGALITFGLTWILTEAFGLWYMFSLVFAVIVATVSNFTFNSLWTFKLAENPKEADYEWKSFYKGNLVQKWWKGNIAKTVWEWIPDNSRLLDIGCGSSPIICNYIGAIGIDKNEDKVRFMREKSPMNSFTTKDTNEFSSGQFDYVLCIEILEHLQEPSKMLEEIARLLKSFGKAVIATPDYSKWLWGIAERFTPYKEEHIVRFDKELLERECAKVGLVPKRYKYIAGCDLCEEFVKECE